MIILLLITLINSLSYECWIEYVGLLTATESAVTNITIEPSIPYIREFDACRSSLGGMYEIKFEFYPIHITQIDIYYEIPGIDDTYLFGDSICNGTCTLGKKYVCCTGNYHEKIRIIVNTNNTDEDLDNVSLAVRSTTEGVFLASYIGFGILCIVFGLIYLGFIGGCVCCIIWKRAIRQIS